MRLLNLFVVEDQGMLLLCNLVFAGSNMTENIENKNVFILKMIDFFYLKGVCTLYTLYCTESRKIRHQKLQNNNYMLVSGEYHNQKAL